MMRYFLVSDKSDFGGSEDTVSERGDSCALFDPDASDRDLPLLARPKAYPLRDIHEELLRNDHANGACKPCLFYTRKIGCAKGIACGFCHSHPKTNSHPKTKTDKNKV
ncbi:unnamed protein product [Polarella glacialis]|uniref:C3H1-type domain-containing protein n=1 Tax=Polarella glacialis TaxID=89957 RepID=A0A813GXV7_POLGL|nr:unnamed protein product [Polarella glacialis]CAE8737924.1 unnamed protein product [Polarella glacialis]